MRSPFNDLVVFVQPGRDLRQSVAAAPQIPWDISSRHRRSWDILLFVGTTALGSFLLFSIEPIVGRMLLPKVGGAPAVWNAITFFFQTVLTVGYGFAWRMDALRP